MKSISTETITIKREYFGELISEKLLANKVQGVQTEITQDGVLIYKEFINTENTEPTEIEEYFNKLNIGNFLKSPTRWLTESSKKEILAPIIKEIIREEFGNEFEKLCNDSIKNSDFEKP